MPMRLRCHCNAALAALVMLVGAVLAGCASSPAEPVPFKPLPAARIVRPGYTEPATGLVAVDVRRERSRDVIVRFRDALVYIDGERVTDLMNGEQVVFYLSPGVHRIGVSTQFDPVLELGCLCDGRPALHEPRVGHLRRRPLHRAAQGGPVAPAGRRTRRTRCAPAADKV
jgi:hypothetical protein